MKKASGPVVMALLGLAAALSGQAQLLNKDAPVIVGHYQLNVTSVEDHKKFWVDTLGGTAMKFGSAGVDVIKFPDVYIFLHKQAPTGSSVGTTINHIGL